MAQHKVPQDVETADKLIGFLSLKQFLFVLAGLGAGFLAFTFSKISILLAIPFVPFVVTFLILGLYQRKDQPVEVYLAAWLKFRIAPKTRVWNQEGYEKHIILSTPKVEVIDYTKGMSRSDVYSRLYGLGNTLDTRGWSAKGVYDATSSRPLGDSTGERLLDLEDIEAMQEKYSPPPPNPTDIFDANNSQVATRVEVKVDSAALHSQDQASQILHQVNLKTSTDLPLQPVTPQITEQLNHLAESSVPISAVSEQAGAINLDQGAEFSLR